MDLTSGIAALLGALIGGYFTSRAAVSGQRLVARADAFEAWEQASQKYNLISIDRPDWDNLKAADVFFGEKFRVFFLAGVPVRVLESYRAGIKSFYGYCFRGEEVPDGVWYYFQWNGRVAQEYLESPLKGWFRDHSLRLWRVRRAMRPYEGTAPAI